MGANGSPTGNQGAAPGAALAGAAAAGGQTKGGQLTGAGMKKSADVSKIPGAGVAEQQLDSMNPALPGMGRSFEGGHTATKQSSDSESSDTEEYIKHRHDRRNKKDSRKPISGSFSGSFSGSSEEALVPQHYEPVSYKVHPVHREEYRPQHDEYRPQHDEHRPQHDEHRPQHVVHKPHHSDHKSHHDEHHPHHDEHHPHHDEHHPHHDEHHPHHDVAHKPHKSHHDYRPHDDYQDKIKHYIALDEGIQNANTPIQPIRPQISPESLMSYIFGSFPYVGNSGSNYHQPNVVKFDRPPQVYHQDIS
uniref:Uncharacterized protein n=1 Tax=Strigamia maritima TaxID=126957 RepID=T1JBK3_STRMM